MIWIYYFLNEIESNQLKFDNLQIEASGENLNFSEYYSNVKEIVKKFERLSSEKSIEIEDVAIKNLP